MKRSALKRIGVAILGAMAAVWALTVWAASTGESMLDRIHALGVTFWVLPLIAGASVGVAAWLVLGTIPEETEDRFRPSESACPWCGKPVRDDWRLCPHCGNLIEADLSGDGHVSI